MGSVIGILVKVLSLFHRRGHQCRIPPVNSLIRNFQALGNHRLGCSLSVATHPRNPIFVHVDQEGCPFFLTR